MQYCGAIILQLKINKLMKNKMDLQKVKKKKPNPQGVDFETCKHFT